MADKKADTKFMLLQILKEIQTKLAMTKHYPLNHGP